MFVFGENLIVVPDGFGPVKWPYKIRENCSQAVAGKTAGVVVGDES